MSQPVMIVEFSDNRLMADLAGAGSRYFVRLEQRFGIKITTRGNLVAISGQARQKAADVMQKFYLRLKSGDEVGMADLDAEIRFALEDEQIKLGNILRTAVGKSVRTRTPAQINYLDAMSGNTMTFAVGPAGTGKTYMAAAYGAALLYHRHVDRLILSRPALEAGERLGFLPGDLKEKIDPYLRPLYDALFEVMGEACNRMIDQGVIEVAPLAFMRGRTLSHAFIILDEAQNCTSTQMKMFLTRLGEDSRMVITGDPTQSDLPGHGSEGLNEALRILANVEDIGIVRFDQKDVIRHALVTRVVSAYMAAENETENARGE